MLDALPVKNHIRASSFVGHNFILKNGIPFFEKKDIGISAFLDAAYDFAELKYPKFYKMDNLSKLGILAADVLLKDASWIKNYSPEDVGIVLSNANASLDTDIKYYKTVKDFASPALFVYTLPNIMIGEICIRHHFKGENAFFISREFDAAFIQQYVDNLINNNILRSCICGWIELLNETCKAVLFLVEKPANNFSGSLLFDQETIHKIYQSDNG
jgi:hypothetical protein